VADLVLSVNPALVAVRRLPDPDSLYTPARRKHLPEEIGLAQPETAVAIVTKCPAHSANE